MPLDLGAAAGGAGGGDAGWYGRWRVDSCVPSMSE